MIEKIAGKIIDKLIKNGEVDEIDRELYEYAVINIIMSFAPVVLALGFGIMLGKVSESMLIIVPYAVIRKFAGGFHFKSMLACFLFSSLFLLDVILLCDRIHNGTGLVTVLFISVLGIIIFSPLDNEKRRLDKKEKSHCKKWTIIFTIAFCLLYIIMIFYACDKGAKCIALGIIITSLLQIPSLPGKIVKK